MQKYTAIFPAFAGSYLAYQLQLKADKQNNAKGGVLKNSLNAYKYSPLKNYALQAVGRNDNQLLDQISKAIYKITNDKKSKSEQTAEKGYEELGSVASTFFSVNPIPYKAVKDFVEIYRAAADKPSIYQKRKDADSKKNTDGKVDAAQEFIKGLAYKNSMFEW